MLIKNKGSQLIDPNLANRIASTSIEIEIQVRFEIGIENTNIFVGLRQMAWERIVLDWVGLGWL